MSNESFILAENITNSDSSVSPSFTYTDKLKGAGYHQNQDNLHTAVYQLNNFTGSVKLQGTLSLYPGDNDWVDIHNSLVTYTDQTGSYDYSVNFSGNFVWIRAAHTILSGDITEIRYNY